MKLNFALVCYKGDIEEGTVHVIHLCCYESRPDQLCVEDLKRELNEEEEFGMIGMEEGIDYRIMLLDREIPDHRALMENELELPEEIDDSEAESD